MENPHRHWVQMHSGASWTPGELNSRIALSDLTISLSRTVRFGGHTRRPYSVAEHICRGAALCTNDTERTAWLLHDLPEALTGDLSGPLKGLLGNTYRALEFEAERQIAALFGRPFPGKDDYVRLDTLMLALEANRLMPVSTGQRRWQYPADEVWDAANQISAWWAHLPAQWWEYRLRKMLKPLWAGQ